MSLGKCLNVDLPRIYRTVERHARDVCMRRTHTHTHTHACMHAASEPLTGVSATGLGCHRKSAVHSSRRTSVGHYVAVVAARKCRYQIRAVDISSVAIKIQRGVACVREGDASQLR